jgi:hypothetical protein
MKINSALKILIFVFFLSFCFFPFNVKADSEINLVVTPALIDIPACEKGRICLEQKITIKNNSAVRADFYALVNDIDDTGLVNYSDPSELPNSASLTTWIDFYRAVIEIPPGQEVTQTLKVLASPLAVPGKYHAVITFSPGPNLGEAQQSAAKLNLTKLMLNMEIKAHTIEQAEVNIFKPAKIIFTNNSIAFKLKIKNIGNVSIAPAGEIVVYNKGGKEVGSIPVKGKSISPNEIIDFSTVGDLKLLPGKYRAKLQLSYGEGNKELSDVVYFSCLPLIFLILLLLVLLGLVFAATYVIMKKRREKRMAEGLPETIEEDEDEEIVEEDSLPKKTGSKKHVLNLRK